MKKEKLTNGVVLSDNLFKEYQRFVSGSKDYSRDTINKILTFRFDGFVSNVKQYQDNDIEMSKELESAMRQSGHVDQPLWELARDYTVYKIILTDEPNKRNFPYVNINATNENVSVSVTGCFKMAEPRAKAIEHIATLCYGAKELIIYDRFIDSSERGVLERIEPVLDKIIPKDKVIVYYNKLLSRTIQYLENSCQQRRFEKCKIRRYPFTKSDDIRSLG